MRFAREVTFYQTRQDLRPCALRNFKPCFFFRSKIYDFELVGAAGFKVVGVSLLCSAQNALDEAGPSQAKAQLSFTDGIAVMERRSQQTIVNRVHGGSHETAAT